MKIALITGITGQDGVYLAGFLLDRGYEVHGLVRRSSWPNLSRLRELLGEKAGEVRLHYGDVTDGMSLLKIIGEIKPCEIYNLAAQSFVQASFEMPCYTGNVNAMGVVNLLEAVKSVGREMKVYQASTSEMFGNNGCEVQDESSPMRPCSPYAAAKLYAYHMTRFYREAYGMFVCNGILFNHESPLRGEEFVTRKITKAVAEIVAGKEDTLFIGSLDSSRDWGHAADYVRGMWAMMQHDTPDDYVLATGSSVTVREFVERAFRYVGIVLQWKGSGENEVGKDATSGRVYVRVDKRFYRPAELNRLRGDASKARRVLGWEPTYDLDALVEEMVKTDLRRLGIC